MYILVHGTDDILQTTSPSRPSRARFVSPNCAIVVWETMLKPLTGLHLEDCGAIPEEPRYYSLKNLLD